MFFTKLKMATFVSLSLVSMVSMATVTENEFYVAPFGSYLHPGGDTEAFDGFGAGLAVGKEINENFNIEIRGFWQQYDNDYSCCSKTNVSLNGDSVLNGGTLDVQWILSQDTLSPYIVAAVGGMNTSYKMQAVVFGKTTNYEKETTSLIFETGVGASYDVTSNIALRGDVRYRLNSVPSEAGSNETSVFNDLTVNFGFVY